MTTEKDNSFQSISVQLTGQNFSYWSNVKKNFLKGKRMCSYVEGTSLKPMVKDKEKDAAKYEKKFRKLGS